MVVGPGKLRPFRPGAEEGRAISALLDRAVETGALEGVLAAVRAGLSGVLVLRGGAGVGKTALLDWAAEQAGDMQVARVAGAEAEMDMGFAGLHQLFVPFLNGLDGLPAPQRRDECAGMVFACRDAGRGRRREFRHWCATRAASA
jgi:hypothetical protein